MRWEDWMRRAETVVIIIVLAIILIAALISRACATPGGAQSLIGMA